MRRIELGDILQSPALYPSAAIYSSGVVIATLWSDGRINATTAVLLWTVASLGVLVCHTRLQLLQTNRELTRTQAILRHKIDKLNIDLGEQQIRQSARVAGRKRAP